MLAEVVGAAHDGAGGSHGGDEVGHSALRIAPDLGGRTFIVRARVIGIGELIEHPSTAFALHLLSEVARAFHAFLLRDVHDLRAEGLHHGTPLRTHVAGHDQGQWIPGGSRHHGQGDAGIATGRLDQAVTRLDLAPLGGTPDHAPCRPILDRPRRVVAFQLDVEAIVADTVESGDANQRRVADEIREHRWSTWPI